MTSKEAQHTDSLLKDIGDLYSNEDHSDIVLNLGGECIPAHRIILASRSEYFAALLYGGLKEATQKEITLSVDTPLFAFRSILQYFYTGYMSFEDLPKDDLLNILVLANKYRVLTLEESIIVHIEESVLSMENVCELFNFSDKYQLTKIKNACNLMIDGFPEEFLKTEDFKVLSAEDFSSIIARDSFLVAEKDVFMAAKYWLEINLEVLEEQRDLILNSVRLQLIDADDLLFTVRSTKLYSDSEILNTMQDQQRRQNMRFRKCKYVYDENIATLDRGSKVTSGIKRYRNSNENIFTFENGSTTYSRGQYYGFTFHRQTDCTGITIDLSERYVANSIRFYLLQATSFYIETSLDGATFTRLVDQSKARHFGEVTIGFEQKIVRFVRIVGTKVWERDFSENEMPGILQIRALQLLFNKKS